MRKILFGLSLLIVAALVLVGCGAGTGQAVSQANNQIQKGDLFLLHAGIVAPTTSSTVGEIIEYKGADIATGSRAPKIKFKQWSTGQTLEYVIQDNQATIKLGGKSFKVGLSNLKIVDSPIQVDFNGDGIVDLVHKVNNLHNTGAAGIAGLVIGSSSSSSSGGGSGGLSNTTAFGGCPKGSISSVCINQTDMFCLGSEQYGDQIISCGGGKCYGTFPAAKCS